MKRSWVIAFLGLQACSEPSFSLRGYTNLSDCRNVIDAELANGAEFEDVFDDELPEGAGVVTELSSSIGPVPVVIEVACYSGSLVSSVNYASVTDDQELSEAIFDEYSRHLDEFFGPADETSSLASRSKTYFCRDSASIELIETWLSDTEYEVSLLVIPFTTQC